MAGQGATTRVRPWRRRLSVRHRRAACGWGRLAQGIALWRRNPHRGGLLYVDGSARPVWHGEQLQGKELSLQTNINARTRPF